MRIAVIFFIAIPLVGCNDPEQQAKDAAHIAIKREDDLAAQQKKAFAAKRDAVVGQLKDLMAAKKWNEASLEASRWRKVNDPEVIALEKSIDAEKDKIFHIEQAQRNKIALAERLAREKEEREAEKRACAQQKRQGVHIGMTSEEVVKCGWGRPESINRSTYSWGVKEQWVYPGYQYLYFDDGKLTSIQNRR